MSYANTLTTDGAFDRYEEVRARLPAAVFPAQAAMFDTLADIADRFDAFVLDAFGVLNVGTTPIDGAIARMAEFRRDGKKLIVLTNSASDPRAAALEKYRTLGFDFTADEVVSSRDVAAARLALHGPDMLWGAISTEYDSFDDLPARVIRLTPDTLGQVDGLLYLSSAAWDADRQAALNAALAGRVLPVVVANPDLVAPREDGLSQEPGLFAHDLADATGLAPAFFGKPFGDAYADVKARLGPMDWSRVAMVGDTLHTDVLGGAAAGLKTVLVARHGLFAGCDVRGYIDGCGIVPDYIVQTT
jgi:HAD superfamily hydrolase (TIGR01450 family)